MTTNGPRKVYMKPKVYIGLVHGCPFMGEGGEHVICIDYVDTDQEWYAMATHMCSCVPRKREGT